MVPSDLFEELFREQTCLVLSETLSITECFGNLSEQIYPLTIEGGLRKL